MKICLRSFDLVATNRPLGRSTLRIFAAIGLSVSALLGVTTSASSSSLDPYSLTGSDLGVTALNGIGGVTPTTLGSTPYNWSSVDGAAYATATILASPEPSVQIEGAITSGVNYLSLAGTAILNYSVRFSGPGPSSIYDPPVYVPVIVQAAGTASCSGNCSAMSSFVIAGTTVNISSGIPWTVNETVSFVANGQYYVTILAGGTATYDPYGGSLTGNFFAMVDPTFTIDPSWQYASQYTIELSDGIGNGATPLPAALPLFASGLSTFGLLVLRRKKKSLL